MLKRLLAKASPILGTPVRLARLCLLCRQPCDETPLLCSPGAATPSANTTDDADVCSTAAGATSRERTAVRTLPAQTAPWERLQVIGDYQAPYAQLIPG